MIYFDNSATTRPYPEVIDTFTKAAAVYFGNPSSLHRLGAEAERLLAQARKQIAAQLGVESDEVVFTSGGTESNNLAIRGAARAGRKHGNHIITTQIEHASVRDTCLALEKEGFEVTFLPVGRDGRVSLKDLEAELRDDTILVSVMHVNNETGAIQPIAAIGSLLKRYPNVRFHVDHVQGIGKVPLDFKAAGADLCSISGHKFHGLKGTGMLYVRKGIKLEAVFTGGSQENAHRSGTENVPGFAAMAKALRLHLEKGSRHAQRMAAVRAVLYDGLSRMEGVEVNSPPDGAPHIVNFSIPGIKSEIVIHALEEQDIFVSTVSACSSRNKSVSETVKAMFHDEERASSVIRISLSYENDQEEAVRVLEAVRGAIIKLQEVMR